jgi:hypothetical protein
MQEEVLSLLETTYKEAADPGKKSKTFLSLLYGTGGFF